MPKYESDADVIGSLRRRGVKFGREDGKNVADASKLHNVGISMLGKLDYLMNYCKYTIYLPQVDLSGGLRHP